MNYGREWQIRLPWQAPPASANDRDHWRVKAKKVAEIRAAARQCIAAIVADDSGQVPPLGRVVVGLTYVPRDRRRRDVDNLVVPFYKALADAIVDTGLVVDDTAAYLLRLMPVIGEPDGDPRIVLEITEVVDA